MRIIGKIDIDKYSCVTEHITTNEVIITDERIQHIKDRHPDDYERFCSKNSVLTFLRIGEKTWRKTLKNKLILYSRE